LGGDIFEIINGIPEYDDSWSCNKNKDENFKDYSKRTIIEAKKYIENDKKYNHNTRYVFDHPRKK